jgi:hypothetical protein
MNREVMSRVGGASCRRLHMQALEVRRHIVEVSSTAEHFPCTNQISN